MHDERECAPLSCIGIPRRQVNARDKAEEKMRKDRTSCMVLLMAILFTPLYIYAGAAFQHGDIYYGFTPGSTTVYVYGLYNTSVSSVTIPSTIDNYYTVKWIGEYAFYRSNIKSLIINKGVTNIMKCAFAGCTNLTSVTIPDSIMSIGDYAFQNCIGITNVTIPDNVTSVGNFAFRHCTGLTSITIGNGVKRIMYGTFAECSKLASVTIPEGVTHIGGRAFADSTYLKSVAIPNTVTIVDNEAFQNCSSLVNMIIGNSVENIRSRAFAGCTGLTRVIIPDSTTNIGSEAFRNCSSIISVTMGCGVRSVEERAFQNCNSLVSLTIGGGVTNICPYVFCDCTNLTEVTIPNSVNSIGDWAFQSCNKLMNIEIPNSVKHVGSRAFCNCNELTGLTIGTGVTRIAYATFEGCVGLTNVTIPDNVTCIEGRAFWNCSGLERVTIGSGMATICNNVFDGCKKLTSVCFEGAPPSTDSSAFSDVKKRAVGTYLPEHKAAWDAVIDGKGYWQGLKMRPAYYTVIYDANNGTGATYSQNVEWGEPQQAADGTFIWEGHYFMGWAFAPDGDVSYVAGDTVAEPTDDCVVRVYAKWSKLTLTAESADWREGTITLRCEDSDASGASESFYNLIYFDEAGDAWRNIDRDDLLIPVPVVETKADGSKVRVTRITDTNFSKRNNGVGNLRYRVVDEDEPSRTADCETRHRHGVFVAVSEYADPVVKDLSTPARESAVLRVAYERYGGGRFGGFRVSLEDSPTRSTVLGMLDILSEKVAPGDVFLFSFMGHGGTGYLCCSDYSSSDGETGRITAEELTNHFKKFCDGAGMVAIIYCCHSASMFVQDNGSFNHGRVGWIFSSQADESTYSDSITSIVCNDGWFNGNADVLNGEYGSGDGDGYVTFWELAKYGFDWTYNNAYLGHRQQMEPANTWVLSNIVAGKVPPNNKPNNMFKWLAAKAARIFTVSNGDVDAAAAMTAANGCRTVGECYALGINPEDPDDDLKISHFEIKDGKPVITLNHTEDGSGNSFVPRVKTLGKANLNDTDWIEVPESGDPSLRFFKVEVEKP